MGIYFLSVGVGTTLRATFTSMSRVRTDKRRFPCCRNVSVIRETAF
jgi:hypothetical protein